MYYSINGKLINIGKSSNISSINWNDLNEIIHKNDEIESFAVTKNEDSGLALLGNLSLDGTVQAKGFFLEDGTKIPEVVKLPKNVSVEDKNLGVNIKKPKTSLHVGGEVRFESPKGTTQFNVDNTGRNIITGVSDFRGNATFQNLEVSNTIKAKKFIDETGKEIKLKGGERGERG